MKILFITCHFPPYAFSEAMCSGKTVLALREAGHEVDVISKWRTFQTYSDDWKEPWLPLQDGLCEIQEYANSKWIKACDVARSALVLHSPALPFVRWGRRALALALRMHEEKRYDVVMTRCLEEMAHVVGRNFARKTGVPWFANWNDPIRTSWPGDYALPVSRFEAWWYDRFISTCMKAATCNTFPSQELMEHFQSCYPALQKVPCMVIPHNCLPEGLFPTLPERAASPVFRMCHSGNLSKERDPRLLLQAMKKVMAETGVDIRLDVMGVSNDFAINTVAEEGMQEQVRFVGSFAYNDALQQLGLYDVLVLLEAKLENGMFFASKLTDYAQAGRPVLSVSPARGFARRMLSTYGGGEIVFNESVDSIAAGLSKLVGAWRSGRLDSSYCTQKLYARWSAKTVADIYDGMFRKFVQGA